jgi:mRNA-degrading endonuclease RelE of RelBE toxin-antitoxin system
MKLRFFYSSQAEKFLTRNRPALDYERVQKGLTLAANKILLAEKNTADITKMGGTWKGYYRIRLGEFRAVFRLVESDPVSVFIEEIERRGNTSYA